MQELLENAAARAGGYLAGLEQRPVAPTAAALARLEGLREPFPAAPSSPEEVLALLDDLGSPATVGVAGPRFFGFVIGGTLPAALAAGWLATAWDQNAAPAAASPAAALLESVALEWMRELFGLPEACAGAFVTGATMANFSSLAAAPPWPSRPSTSRSATAHATRPTTRRSSRGARGVEVWAALRSLGRSGRDELVHRCCRHASRFAAGLDAAGYEILNAVQLNQVLVSFGEPDATARAIRALQAEGTCWCGPTVWQGRSAMRISVSSWATTEADVERSLEAMIRVARQAREA